MSSNHFIFVRLERQKKLNDFITEYANSSMSYHLRKFFQVLSTLSNSLSQKAESNFCKFYKSAKKNFIRNILIYFRHPLRLFKNVTQLLFLKDYSNLIVLKNFAQTSVKNKDIYFFLVLVK